MFEAEGVEIVDIPYHAPNANAYAERLVRTVREECLDHVMVVNERHLRKILNEYVTHYNACRPHQGLAQDSPDGLGAVSGQGPICCRKVLGSIYSRLLSRSCVAPISLVEWVLDITGDRRLYCLNRCC